MTDRLPDGEPLLPARDFTMGEPFNYRLDDTGRPVIIKHTPPMWADNPARTRRTHYKPTRRVK